MWRSSLQSISWLCHQMFYTYVMISAAQARKSDNLHHTMSPFSLFLYFFFLCAKNLGIREAMEDRSGASSKNRENRRSLWAALWRNWPPKDADPELRHSKYLSDRQPPNTHFCVSFLSRIIFCDNRTECFVHRIKKNNTRPINKTKDLSTLSFTVFGCFWDKRALVALFCFVFLTRGFVYRRPCWRSIIFPAVLTILLSSFSFYEGRVPKQNY